MMLCTSLCYLCRHLRGREGVSVGKVEGKSDALIVPTMQGECRGFNI